MVSPALFGVSLKDDFLAWQQLLPIEITSDALWHATAYRLALFASDRCWPDLRKLTDDPCSRHIADQLGRALGSIPANYSEAYSRSGVADRCRFYEYSLGSTREARAWYFKARHVISEERIREALELLTSIARLLTVTIVRERARAPKKPKGRHL